MATDVGDREIVAAPAGSVSPADAAAQRLAALESTGALLHGVVSALHNAHSAAALAGSLAHAAWQVEFALAGITADAGRANRVGLIGEQTRNALHAVSAAIDRVREIVAEGREPTAPPPEAAVEGQE